VLAWILSFLFLLVSLSAIVGNWLLLFQKFVDSRRGKDNTTSFVLFLGGLSGAAALALAPIEMDARWYLLPAALDFGSVPYILLAFLALIHERIKQTSRPRSGP